MRDRCKRPQGPKNQASEPSAARGPDFTALMNWNARPTAARKGQPFDLDGAMQAISIFLQQFRFIATIPCFSGLFFLAAHLVLFDLPHQYAVFPCTAFPAL